MNQIRAPSLVCTRRRHTATPSSPSTKASSRSRPSPTRATKTKPPFFSSITSRDEGTPPNSNPSLPVHSHPPGTKRFNVLAWPGGDADADSAPMDPIHRRPRVLVTSHIDVVPPWIPYSTSDPPHALGPDTIIRGRGSVDAKGSVAAQITAVESLLASAEVNPEDLMLLYVVGEETTGDGMKNFSAAWRDTHPGFEFDAAIFGEPTGNKLACGHKGITGGWLRARGKAGHSGYPELGKSATELLMRALVKVLDADLGSSDRFGKTTVNVGRLTGGVAGNVIAKDAAALLTVRIAAGNFTSGPRILRDKLDEILKETDDDAFSYEFTYAYGPVECNCDVEGECAPQIERGDAYGVTQGSKLWSSITERTSPIYKENIQATCTARELSSLPTAITRNFGSVTWRKRWKD